LAATRFLLLPLGVTESGEVVGGKQGLPFA
jgi:hypothetical protein